MRKEHEAITSKILSVPTMILIATIVFALLLVFAPMMAMGASNSTNGTAFEQTTSNWTERANLTVTATTSGTIVLIGTFDVKTNFSTSKAQGRLLKDGVVLVQSNLTESVYRSNGIVFGTAYVTAGTYKFAVETYTVPGSKLSVSNWSFYVGVEGAGGGGASTNASNLSEGTIPNARISALPEANLALNYPTHTNADVGQNISISELQENDTYFNSSVFSNSTDFRNNTILTKEPIIIAGTSNQFLSGTKTWITLTYANITNFNATVQSLITAYGYITNTTAQITRSQVTGQIAIDNNQNTSFQDSSGSIYLTNGSNAISSGYYDVEGLIPASGTISYMSLDSRYTGAINVSLLYNVSRSPVYPQDVFVTVEVSSGGFAENTSVGKTVVNKGRISAYVNSNDGNINSTNLGFILTRN